MRKPSVSRLFGLFVCVAIISAVTLNAFSLSSGRHLQAAPSQPPTVWSYYIIDGSYTTIKTLGCNQGKFDASTGRSSEVVLDFGVQTSDGSGAVPSFNQQISLSTATIEQMAVWFAAEYYSCTGNDSTTVLALGLGTNDSANYGSGTYTTLGTDWANLVSSTENAVTADGYSSQSIIWGANDIETWDNGAGYSVPSADAYGWVNGYASKDPAPYVNYGSADGCPYNYIGQDGNLACNDGYSQADYYYFSWGAAPALVAPEVYHPSNGVQWTNISLYAKISKGVTMQFEAPWDEYGLPGSSGELTSTQAWNDFSSDLTQGGVDSSMLYSMEVHCEYAGRC